MKKSFKTMILATIMLISFFSVAFSPISYAAPTSEFAKSVETTFFGDVEDDGNGCSVFMIINLVLDIFTGAVGIAAVIGIMVAGTQYLSAKGNEQQAAKAKNRIVEIVIGIFAYVLLYSALNFLLPGGKFSNSGTCPKSTEPSTSQTSGANTPQPA